MFTEALRQQALMNTIDSQIFPQLYYFTADYEAKQTKKNPETPDSLKSILSIGAAGAGVSETSSDALAKNVVLGEPFLQYHVRPLKVRGWDSSACALQKPPPSNGSSSRVGAADSVDPSAAAAVAAGERDASEQRAGSSGTKSSSIATDLESLAASESGTEPFVCNREYLVNVALDTKPEFVEALEQLRQSTQSSSNASVTTCAEFPRFDFLGTGAHTPIKS